MKSLQAISEQLSATLCRDGRLDCLEPVGGGDIHRAFRARFGDAELFVKSNRAEAAGMFETEFAGLAALRQARNLRVPRPICHGADQDNAWLVMEYIPLTRRGDSHALGHGLAGLHRMHGPRYGWSHDNYIGATPQPNAWTDDWLEFWRHNRLEYQVRLAVRNGHPTHLATRVRRLYTLLPTLFRDYGPAPSMLHGDLWGGNHGYTERGGPVVFDPACYYGDRETDLAMTELFGGFDVGFYDAYAEAYPLHDGYRHRKHLYQLYHVLNHLNLFGRTWLPRAEALLNRLVGRER